jgi:hypothetical protein
MGMNSDPLPAGVRWAVRILRFCGFVIILPTLCLLPFILLPACFYAFSEQGSTWVNDLLWIGYCLPLAMGGAMRVTATCIEISHDSRFILTDSGMEWKNFTTACLCILATGFCYGAVVSVVKLGFAWSGKHADFTVQIMNLLLHVGVAILLYVSDQYLEKWFNHRRKRHEDEP